MKRRTWCTVLLALIVLPAMVGCMTMTPVKKLPVSPVSRDRGEEIIVDQVFLLADVSASMGRDNKMAVEKSLLESFVAAMPNDGYSAALMDFGGTLDFGKLHRPTVSAEADLLSRQLMPLQPFHRTELAKSAAGLKYISGTTPLDVALNKVHGVLDDISGPTAAVIFSDGGVRSEKKTMNCARHLIDSYGDVLCIHTVQIGDDPKGAAVLDDLAEMSECGTSRNATHLNSGSEMKAFVREVMLGEARDSDGDGVPDKLDECPDTPAGVEVDDVGCPVDSDGDGVPDYTDECPDTPEGVEVDDVGCPVDTDGDGVPDYKDECPDTLAGAKVDRRGCWTIPGAFFDYDKADVKAEYRVELNEVALILGRNPDVKLRLEGHTDSRGSDAYNKTLSERRAKAVMEYLVARGISADRLTAAGWGESKPARPNDTEENMAMNRRVELVIMR